MAKPIGPSCNLRCAYCFYLEKKALFPAGEQYRMSDEVLEAYIRQCARANADTPSGILFAWQGGEPALLGLDFFRRAVELEKKYAAGKPFSNSFQTNGTLLDDEWCAFLAEHEFLVGLSLDGPAYIHDRYRVDAHGGPTFDSVMRSLELLRKHGVEYNILACVSREAARHPIEVYDFFKRLGVRFIQFTPIVERMSDEVSSRLGLRFGTPPSFAGRESGEVTPETVEPEEFGEFLNALFDEWVRNDVGAIFIMNIEWTMYGRLGGDGPVCSMSKRCGNALIVEHNGDVYSCDHFVYPEYRLGNVLTDDVRALAASNIQRDWGARKELFLPRDCRSCDVVGLCRGGCPKHRFRESADGEPGRNYLCAGYKKYYRHAEKYLRVFKVLIENALPCAYIMKAIDQPLMIPAGAGANTRPLMIWVK